MNHYGLQGDFFYGPNTLEDGDEIGRTIFGKVLYGVGQSVKAAVKATGSIVQGDVAGAGQAFKDLNANMKAESATWKKPAPTTEPITDGFWRADHVKVYRVIGNTKQHVPNGDEMAAWMQRLNGSTTWVLKETTTAALAPFVEVPFVSANQPAPALPPMPSPSVVAFTATPPPAPEQQQQPRPPAPSSNTPLLIGGGLLALLLLK